MKIIVYASRLFFVFIILFVIVAVCVETYPHWFLIAVMAAMIAFIMLFYFAFIYKL